MKTKKQFGVGLASVALSVLFLLCACSQPTYVWTLQDLGTDVDFHSELQAAYLADSYTSISSYAKGTAELSLPQAVHFAWDAQEEKESGVTISSYTLEISAESDFSTSLTYTTTATEMDVYNLQIATAYYWRVTAELSNGKESVSKTSTFITTSTAPRNIYVEGVTNMRDLGGWETEDGSYVKQGMIYRCGRLNESEADEVVVEITENGIDVMLNQLGIRSEVDLRRVDNNEVGSITSSPLGDTVNYYSCPMEWNTSNILTDNVAMVKTIFSILADEDNYPIIYHCNIGTDRTGLFAFLLNGLMGVPEEDLYRDYLFSNFGNIGGSRTTSGIQNSYVKTIKSYAGDSLSEQIYNCLVDLGIPGEDIDSVCALLTE